MAPRKNKKSDMAEMGSLDLDAELDALGKELDNPSISLKRGVLQKNTLTSGSLSLDLLLGGGWPGGRWSTVLGPEGGGKSTLTFYAIATAVARGTRVLHFDAEGAANPDYMERIGVPIEGSSLYRYIQPSTGESVFRMLHRLLDKLPDVAPSDNMNIPFMFVVDSLPALVPEARAADDTKSPIGQLARMYAENIALIRTPLAKKNCVMFAVNQMAKTPSPYGDPWVEKCGEAPKYASDLRLKLVSKTAQPPHSGKIAEEECWDEDGVDQYRYFEATTLKNKLFPPFKSTMGRLWFSEKGMPGRGIDPYFDLQQYLEMTGQLLKPKQGRFEISIPGPWTGKTLLRADIKKLALDPAYTKDKTQHLPTLCREQITSGAAFQMYANILGKTGAGSADPEETVVESEGSMSLSDE